MKAFRIALVVALWVAAAQAQTIRVADNNVNAPVGDGSVNVYTTLQAAIDASVDGDIIHVIPSMTSYGNVTVDKELTIVGPGWYLPKDRPVGARANSITLASGASGSRISGMYVYGSDSEGIRFSADATGIVIEKCAVHTVASNTGGFPWSPTEDHHVVSGLVLRHCRIWQRVALYNVNNTDMLITHNIFERAELGFKAGATVTNNVFIASAPSGGGTWNIVNGSGYLNNGVFENNIFYGAVVRNDGRAASNRFRYNLVYRTREYYETAANDFPDLHGNTQSDNIKGQDPLFVRFPTDGSDGMTPEYDLHLQTGSPCIGAGSDGTDIGLYGGTTPLNSVAMPLIQRFVTSDVVEQGQDLDVEIKARSK